MDLILCATKNNKNTLIRIYPEIKNKIYTLKEYTQNNNEDLIEPSGYDIEIYRMSVSEIEKCIDKLLEKINIKSEEK